MPERSLKSSGRHRTKERVLNLQPSLMEQFKIKQMRPCSGPPIAFSGYKFLRPRYHAARGRQTQCIKKQCLGLWLLASSASRKPDLPSLTKSGYEVEHLDFVAKKPTCWKAPWVLALAPISARRGTPRRRELPGVLKSRASGA